MNVQLIIPKWSYTMPWVDQIQEVFKMGGHKTSIADSKSGTPDVLIYGWFNKETIDDVNKHEKTCPIIIFQRRYEMYQPFWQKVDHAKIDQFYCVNEFFKRAIESHYKTFPVDVLYNGVNLKRWTYRPREHGKNVAMVGFINPRKNIPLALQIMKELPKDYTLYLVGDLQCLETYHYIDHFSKKNKIKVIWSTKIPSERMNKWLDDKDYLLCCSLSEGNPNNVLEAMAKGIKPVIHRWPGSEWQFEHNDLFSTVAEAVQMIDPKSSYDSERWRDTVEENFSSKNYITLLNRCEELTSVQPSTV